MYFCNRKYTNSSINMKHFGLFLLLLVVLVSCIESPKMPRVELKTMTLNARDLVIDYPVSASLSGEQDVQILPQVSGKLQKINVTMGQEVKQGQVLFVIDQVQAQADLRNALASLKVSQAQAATAKIELESKLDLRQKNIVSDIQVRKAQNEYATAVAMVEQAEAVVTNARQVLSFTTVVSPCNGIVGELPYRVGSVVGPDMAQPLTIISNNRRIYANMAVTERELLDAFHTVSSNSDDLLKLLPHVRLRTADGRIYDHEGYIESISGVINKTTGTMSVRAIFPNEGGTLRSGGAAEILIPDSLKGVVVIPQVATYELQNKVFAFKVENKLAKSVEIRVSPLNNGQEYVVLSGLKSGDVIVAEGAGNIHDGDSISYTMKM